VLRAYGDIYADAKFDAIVQPVARWPTRDMATRGLAGPKALLSVIIVRTLLVGPIFATDSSQGAFGARMRKNVPSAMIGAPLLVAQGWDDALALPDVQDRFVAGRWKAGQRLDHRTYGGANASATGRTRLPRDCRLGSMDAESTHQDAAGARLPRRRVTAPP
jgi:hypothetical protein